MLMAVMMMMIKRSFILRLDSQRSVDFQLLGPSRHFSKIYNLFESVEQNSLALIEALAVSLQYYNFCHFYFVFGVFLFVSFSTVDHISLIWNLQMEHSLITRKLSPEDSMS